MNKSARAFYDLEKLKSIPIAEVAQAYGIEVKPSGTDFWCKLRDERTPSCKLYTKTNSFCDFGNTNYGGDTIQLTAFLHSCSRADAIEILANTFGIAPENQATYNRFPSDRQLAKIGIQGDRATKNFDFHPDKYGDSVAMKISEKYAMTVERLSEQYPDVYHQMLRAKAVPYVHSLRQMYLAELRQLYEFSVSLGLNFQTNSELFDEARELMRDAQTSEHILHNAIHDFQKVPFQENQYALDKDYAAIAKGRMSVELVGYESLDYRDLKTLLKAGNRSIAYSKLPCDKFYALSEKLQEITAVSAFAKGDTVTLAYDSTYADQIEDLINFNQEEQLTAAETVNMLPTM